MARQKDEAPGYITAPVLIALFGVVLLICSGAPA